MALTAGLKLGPYEIVAPIGAGGMGEVYRARDPRLGRDVAIKVLPAAFATDRDRLQRFEHEARAAGALNHPAIVAIYDVGASDGFPYLVTELLEGQSLRQALDEAALPPRRALEVAIQAAQGLAAAHAKGIVHRDLKPENLFLLPDGRLKILDFGLAKLTRPDAPEREETGPQLQALTATGTILGTASYMAPEQIRESAVDHRADFFALGAILYEMFTGRKAFPGATPADRMTAILTLEPEPLARGIEEELPGIGATLARLIGKKPESRFDSARDLAFALELILDSSATRRATPATGPSGAELPRSEPQFRRLTFRDGLLNEARFAPDGQTVVYSGAWEGGPPEISVTRVDSPESRSIGVTDAELLSVGPSSELAVRMRTIDVGGFVRLGTLARVPLLGGIPREMTGGVFQADWGPDGKNLAVLRDTGDGMRLDYPVGTTLYESKGWMSHVRTAPDGRRVAFLDHPSHGTNSGGVALAEAGRATRWLVLDWALVWGLTWAPDGNEIWFSGMPSGGSEAVYAVSMDGHVRVVHGTPGYVLVHDRSRNGDTLLERSTPKMRIEFRRKGEEGSTELSWLDWSLVRDITPDGSMILFDESGLGVDQRIVVFMRRTDGGPAIGLGEGGAAGFSPDGRLVLAGNPDDESELILYPIGAGEATRISAGEIALHSGYWFPDGRSICLSGYEPGGKTRLYRYDLERRALLPITDEGVGRRIDKVSPDGRWVVADDSTGRFALYPTEGGAPVPLAGIRENERPVGWSNEEGVLYVFQRGGIPAQVHRLDVRSGAREPWLELVPRNRSGVDGINALRITPDGTAYAFSYMQILCELYMGRGLR